MVRVAMEIPGWGAVFELWNINSFKTAEHFLSILRFSISENQQTFYLLIELISHFPSIIFHVIKLIGSNMNLLIGKHQTVLIQYMKSTKSKFREKLMEKLLKDETKQG
jgi:hypothetical protein